MQIDSDRWREYVALVHSSYIDDGERTRHVCSIVRVFLFFLSFLWLKKKYNIHIYIYIDLVRRLAAWKKERERRLLCLHVIHVLCLTGVEYLLLAYSRSLLQSVECNVHDFLKVKILVRLMMMTILVIEMEVFFHRMNAIHKCSER